MKDIRPVQKDPYEKIKVHPSEESRDKEKFKKEEKKKSHAIAANFFLLMKKFIDFFSSEKEKKKESAEAEEDLLNIRECFSKIYNEEVSADVEFFKKFSHCWKRLLKIVQSEDITSFQKTHLKNLMQEMQTYPENQEFTLAYYLQDFQGEDWVPFAYTEMIQKLHLESQNNPEGNRLNNWINQVNNIINST